MTTSSPRRRRIFAHIGSRTAARLALCSPAGWLVKTKLLLPVGEIIELSLRLGDERRSVLVPATVVGRRPGEGILVRVQISDLLAADRPEDPPPPVTLTFASYADLEDAVSRILCGQRVQSDDPLTAEGEVFLRLCIWGEPTARLAFPATLLRGASQTEVVVRLDDVAARRAVRSFLHLTDSAGRAAL